MTYIYLASPYTHHDEAVRESRYEAVRDATAWLMRKQQWVFSPILHCHDLAKAHGLPVDHIYWDKYDYQMVKSANGILVLTIMGWTQSEGIKKEIKWAGELGLPVKYMRPVRTRYVVSSRAPKNTL